MSYQWHSMAPVRSQTPPLHVASPASVNDSSSQTPHSKSSSQTPGSAPRSQAELKSILVEELHDAVFQSDSLLDRVYPLPSSVPRALTDAIDTLGNGFTGSSPKPSQQSSRRSRRNPGRGRGRSLTGSHPLAGTRAKLNTSNERKNYEALVKIFNTILECAGQHDGYHSTLKFIEYDKTTTDRADGQGALKPDAAGIHREITPTTRYPWCDIHVVVEIKGVWREGLKQAATYGRSMLQQGRRWYSLVITYNHVKQTLRFCFFTRIGLFTTPALPLTTLEGFRAIARGLLGLAYSTRQDAGIDEHHLVRGGSSYIFLPTSNGKGRWWKVSDLLCQRICIRGRATHVYCALALPDWPQDDAGSSQDITAVTQGLVELNISSRTYP